MKRRTYVKMSTWMQPVVWMRLGRAGLRLQDVSELARGVQPGGSLRLPDVSELARGVARFWHVAVVVDGEVMSASVHS